MGNIELGEAKNLSPKSDAMQRAPDAYHFPSLSCKEFEVQVDHTSFSSKNQIAFSMKCRVSSSSLASFMQWCQITRSSCCFTLLLFFMSAGIKHSYSLFTWYLFHCISFSLSKNHGDWFWFSTIIANQPDLSALRRA